ncbi:MAG TPA: RNA polymerase sigma factor [Polyangia bacterium]|nr:RNA polymerase sigma factor [Polyangia bacterium]
MGSVPALSDNGKDRPHLQVLVGGARIAATPSAGRPGARAEQGRDAKFREIYERWFDDVVGWLYALGAPMSETEDLAQEIFLVVRRKLSRFDGGNLAGWLYRITQLTVRDHRRRAWFRNLVLRRQEVDLTKMPHGASSPARSYEAAETRVRFQAMVGKMSEKLRTTFVLFEVEGYSGEEIARIQDIPLGTVWTRLHKARKEFWKLVTEQRAREEGIR